MQQYHLLPLLNMQWSVKEGGKMLQRPFANFYKI
jgi:hypothetical protein